jgi:hypothetical protein
MNPAPPSDGMALPIAGCPLSAHILAIAESLGPDGTVSRTVTLKTRVVRDSAGRTRHESTMSSDQAPEQPFPMIRIVDPTSGFPVASRVAEPHGVSIQVPPAPAT